IDSRGKKSVSISKRKDNVCLFTPDMMHGLGENYYHISFFVLRKTIYLGYSPQVPVKQKAEDIIYSDLSEFYKIKFKDFEVREVTNFEDIYKRKLSKLDEYKLFKKFQQAKKENKTDEFAKKENLVNVNFELLFKNYIPDDKVIDSKMSLLNADERFELLKQWQAISDDDHEAQVEFIEKHNLWGACPAIFENIGENLDDLTDL
ncbi:MAG: hypothetical protein U9R50_11670, partial [Campylobacterota bacterium]|nr:hypothetical protein [Campylobacterota bacterium]